MHRGSRFMKLFRRPDPQLEHSEKPAGHLPASCTISCYSCVFSRRYPGLPLAVDCHSLKPARWDALVSLSLPGSLPFLPLGSMGEVFVTSDGSHICPFLWTAPLGSSFRSLLLLILSFSIFESVSQALKSRRQCQMLAFRH